MFLEFRAHFYLLYGWKPCTNAALLAAAAAMASLVCAGFAAPYPSGSAPKAA